MNYMKYKNILRKQWIILFAFIFIFIFLFSLFALFIGSRYFHLYEGIVQVKVKNTENIKYIIIEPISKEIYTSFLQLSEFIIYDYNGKKIDYTASSSNGILNDDKKYDYIALTDSDNTTYFQSGNVECTLKIIPKNPELKISKILIKNIVDECCIERLRSYKISIVNENFDVFFTKDFSDMENLYTSPFMEEILIDYEY
jgi:hypothetical protein